jgi:hypothetical protein
VPRDIGDRALHQEVSEDDAPDLTGPVIDHDILLSTCRGT